MLTFEQFTDFWLNEASAKAAPAAAPTPKRPAGGFARPTVTRPVGEQGGAQTSFVRRLLEKSGFGAGQLFPRSQLILGQGADAAMKYLPEEVYHFPHLQERPFDTLLFEFKEPVRELLQKDIFRASLGGLALAEDALARLCQTALRGFEIGKGRGQVGIRPDHIPGAPQELTLCVVSIRDDRESGEQTDHLIYFATVIKQGEEESLESFSIRQEARTWEPQLRDDYVQRVFYRHFSKLKGSGWKDAFLSEEERKKARALLNVYSVKPLTREEIEKRAKALLEELAGTFKLSGQKDKRLQPIRLPENHDIGADPERLGAETGKGSLPGLVIRDQAKQLMGYILYCLDSGKDAVDLRENLRKHNRFHNVLVIYPDNGTARIELWQGKVPLEGKLTQAGVRYSDEGRLVNLLSRFFVVSRNKVRKPDELAQELAYRARYLRAFAARQMKEESEKGPLRQLYKSFRESLVHNQSILEFADAYAQTLAYGLLTARWLSRDGYADGNSRFTRKVAQKELHRSTSPFLIQLFQRVLEDNFEPRLVWLLDDIADLLDRTNIKDVFEKVDPNDLVSSDPVIHFYEPFLEAYDREMRKKRGVYFTPEPVVSFIVSSVDQLLRDELKLPLGLADTTTWEDYSIKHGVPIPTGADPRSAVVQILDPATGTGTFLKQVIEVIHRTMAEEWTSKGLSVEAQAAEWCRYVPGLLRRLHGFELMVASYAICHLKLALELRQTGYSFADEERIGVYLTNALEAVEGPSGQISMIPSFIDKEGRAAENVKGGIRITVVMGNPPYSGVSANMSSTLADLIEPYKYVDGQPLGERKQWLHDDYVKFIRRGQMYLDFTGMGILAYISNHGYADNQTFRGMRQSLLHSFSQIYIIDLHGNTKKKENPPEGMKDANVFDIQQGVCCGVMLKKPSEMPKSVPTDLQLFYKDVWGEREEKYIWLRSNFIRTVSFRNFCPASPSYLFVPVDESYRDEYERGWKLTELMPVNSTGIVTARDRFVIDFEDGPIETRIKTFLNSSYSDDDVKQYLHLGENYAWRVSEARAQLKGVGNWKRRLVDILYRPFDLRRIIYHSSVVWRVRSEVMSHMLAGRNFGLVARRQMLPSRPCTYFFFSKQIVSDGAIRSDNHGSESLFPLYIYENSHQFGCEERAPENSRPSRCNLAHQFTSILKQQLNLEFLSFGRGDFTKTFGPEDVISYIYSVFHSPNYRTRYAEFLKVDFPKVPMIANRALFTRLCSLGHELVSLHLLESPRLAHTLTRFVGRQSPEVEKVSWSRDTVWIDKKQTTGFAGVPEDVWNFHIGGYQVCEKWLKDRKGRTLSSDDVAHYHKIVVALSETIRIMAEIDQVIEAHGGWPGAFTAGK